MAKNKTTLTARFRANPWILATVVLGILVIILLAGNYNSFEKKNIISSDAAAEIVLDFANSQNNKGNITLVNVTTFEEDLYVVAVLFNGKEIPVFITKDGTTLVQRATASIQSADADE